MFTLSLVTTLGQMTHKLPISDTIPKRAILYPDFTCSHLNQSRKTHSSVDIVVQAYNPNIRRLGQEDHDFQNRQLQSRTLYSNKKRKTLGITNACNN